MGVRGHGLSLVRIVRLSASGSGVTDVHTEVAPMRERRAGPGRRRPKPEPLEPLTPDEYAGRTDAEEDRQCEDRDLRPVPSQAEGDRETVEEDLRLTERRTREEGGGREHEVARRERASEH